jgi:hypothetical protein
MADKIAIKRLTPSDCTLFEAVFRQIGAGNQKSINLNADVFVSELFPAMSSRAVGSDTVIALPISVYGPEAKPAYNIARKIIKNSAYKNWRLNGEFIHGPPEDPSRYDDVRPGDLAVMIFRGDLEPTAMDLILVGQSNATDTALHLSLLNLFGAKSMISATPSEIAEAILPTSISAYHPIHRAAADPEFDASLEDAAQGGFEGTSRLLRNRRGRRVSIPDLAKAKAKAELNGRSGEALVNAYLAAKLGAGEINAYAWISRDNAVAPFDFEIVDSDGQKILVDAKATSGSFEQAIHISLAEIIEAAGMIPYRLYRVFDINEDGGKLRVSENLNSFAVNLKGLHEAHLPQGVRVDSFSVATSTLSWGAAETIEALELDDGD